MPTARPSRVAPVTPLLVGTITVVAVLLAALGWPPRWPGGASGWSTWSVAGRARGAAAGAGGRRRWRPWPAATGPADTPTFLGYLLGVVLVPVAGVLWARTELTRWAGTVLAVAGAVVGVMVWRLLQLWEATGA